MIKETIHNLQADDTAKTLVNENIASKKYSFFNCCNETNINQITSVAEEITRKYKNIAVVGSGGSINAGITYNKLSQNCITFFDNIDPDSTSDKIASIESPTQTCVIFISKSGKSEEILVLYNLIQDHFRKYNCEPSDNFYVITQIDDNPLFNIAKGNKNIILPHADDIGGRFSYLSIVGLLVAAISGLNIRDIQKGAEVAITKYLSDPKERDLLCSRQAKGMLEKKIHANISMVYNDKLMPFQVWHQQLWAESLGKENLGSIPVAFSGTRDQHSQLQLYLANPSGKVFNLIKCENFAPENYNLTKIFNTHADNVIKNLIETKQIVRTITMPNLNEYYLGILMTNMVIETLLCAEFMGINPFGQTKVEAIKIARLAAIKESFTQ